MTLSAPRPRRLARRSGALLALLLGALVPGALAQPAEAQTAQEEGARPTAPVLRAARTDAGIRLDGRLDEAAWQDAEAATGFTQFRPEVGAEPSQRTAVRILYTNEALYVGARMYDAAPDSIVARLARRDDEAYSDWFTVALDSYNDNRTAFAFKVNPRGVQADFLIYDDTDEDDDWDAVWDAAAAIDAEGWTAELRIPLSQLRFSAPEDAESLVWGAEFVREIARRQEESAWAPLDPEADRLVSVFGSLTGLAGLDPPSHLELVPYAVGRLTRAPGDPASPFFQENDPFAALGGDLKYGLTSNLTLNATINPDFGQVEADPSEVNLSAFESFFSEKRPFFIEGADIFSLSGPTLFYSRRIGRAPRGSAPGEAVYRDAPQQTTILGAAKVTGRTRSGWQLGALEAVTAEEEARFIDAEGAEHSAPVEPLTNYAALRASRNLREGASAVGGVFTATNRPRVPERLGFLHTAAYTGGLDGRHRFSGDAYEAKLTLLGSHVRGSTDALLRTQGASARYFQRPDAAHLAFDSTRTTLSGWSADATVRKISGRWQWGAETGARSPGFEINDLGFLNNADRLFGGLFGSYNNYSAGRVFRAFEAGGFLGTNRTFGGEHTGTFLEAWAEGQLKNYWGFFGGANLRAPSLAVTKLRGGPALRSNARANLYGGIRTDGRKRVELELKSFGVVEHGAAGYYYSFDPEIEFKPTSAAEISLEPSFSIERNPDQFVATATASGAPVYVLGRIDQRTAAMTVRADYAFTPDLSLQLYAQPFISAGRYTRFAEVSRPRAAAFAERFARFDGRLFFNGETGLYDVDYDADGAFDPDASADFSFSDPDFNVRELNATLVLRWEYRPGSQLFVVWSRGQAASASTGRFDLWRDTGDLFRAESTNTLLVKLSYWFGV